MNISTDPWIWIAALLSLFIFSFIFKDNPLFKFAEHLLVGISAGYFLAIYWHNSIYPNIIAHIKRQEFLYIIPLLLGLLYFSIFIPKYAYLIRWPIAYLLGAASGLSIPVTIDANIYRQIENSILMPLNNYPNYFQLFNSIIILTGVLATLTYFYFSREHRGVIRPISRYGIWILMIGFGASFGYTVMARVSLLIGRLYFLLGDWLGIIKI